MQNLRLLLSGNIYVSIISVNAHLGPIMFCKYTHGGFENLHIICIILTEKKTEPREIKGLQVQGYISRKQHY